MDKEISKKINKKKNGGIDYEADVSADEDDSCSDKGLAPEEPTINVPDPGYVYKEQIKTQKPESDNKKSGL